MSDKKVSIITPAYNASGTILETYESIKAQTFSDWEWLVVDDCSTDNTKEIINDLAKKDKRIKVFQTETNSGAAKARNIAIENACGRFIAFLDADDLWTKEKLEHQIQFMLDNDYAFTYGNYEVFVPDKKKSVYRPKESSIGYKKLLAHCDIGTLTVMYDVEKIGKHYMPLDAVRREDHAAWLDMTRDGLIAYKLDEVIASYRINPSSVSYNKIKLFKYQYRLYRHHEHFGVLKSFFYTLRRTFNKVFKKYIY